MGWLPKLFPRVPTKQVRNLRAWTFIFSFPFPFFSPLFLDCGMGSQTCRFPSARAMSLLRDWQNCPLKLQNVVAACLHCSCTAPLPCFTPAVTKGWLCDSAQSKLQARVCIPWQKKLCGLFVAAVVLKTNKAYDLEAQLLVSFSMLNPNTRSVHLLGNRQDNLWCSWVWFLWARYELLLLNTCSVYRSLWIDILVMQKCFFCSGKELRNYYYYY